MQLHYIVLIADAFFFLSRGLWQGSLASWLDDALLHKA